MRDGTGKKEQTNKSEKGRDIGSMGGEQSPSNVWKTCVYALGVARQTPAAKCVFMFKKVRKLQSASTQLGPNSHLEHVLTSIHKLCSATIGRWIYTQLLQNLPS